MPAQQRRQSANVGGQNPEFILRDFEGMNTLTARQDIADEELWWCENLLPVAPGRLLPLNNIGTAFATISGENGAPTYTMEFNQNGTDYAFAVWSTSGNGWIVNLSTGAMTNIISGSLTSGQTQAVGYNSSGLLIIDPAGYWDWNLTAPATLTPQNNALVAGTINYSATTAGGTSLTQGAGIVATLGGTGATAQTIYQVTSVTVNAAGSGYVVGDALNLTDGSPTTPAQIVVASVGGSGNITGITLSTGGSYPGPAPGAGLVAIGPAGSAISGGTGTGATFKVTIRASGVTILTRGYGYIGNVIHKIALIEENSSSTEITSVIFTTSGVIGGTAIATYAGRVWIALLRTFYFTDVDSYNSFGGAGGFFTISDSYFSHGCTAEFSANNYLYIFSDSSIDVLSNVTVNNGVTSFSRVNIVTNLGCSQPNSITGYYRALVFYHSTGIYLLSGSTPEKISEKISGLISAVVPGVTVYSQVIQLVNELCLTVTVTFVDTFTAVGGTRTLLLIYFRGKWSVASFISVTLGPAFAEVIAGVATLWVWVGNQLVQAFQSGYANNWLVMSKLFDGGVPLHEKQSLNFAIGGLSTGTTPTNINFTVDTENGSSAAITLLSNNVAAGHDLVVQQANEGGTQYLGWTVSTTLSSQFFSVMDLMALRGKTERDMLT